jgi:hypothetical protein
METSGATFATTGAATVIVTVVLVLSPSSSVARKVTVLAPSDRDRLAEVPVATTEPPTSHSVLETLPSESVADAERDTVSPALESPSETVLSPPEMETTGATFATNGAETVIVTSGDFLVFPVPSSARKLTTLMPSKSGRLVGVTVVSYVVVPEPFSTLHLGLERLLRESGADNEKGTVSPVAPSLSGMVLSPPAILICMTEMTTLVLELLPSALVDLKITSVAPGKKVNLAALPLETFSSSTHHSDEKGTFPIFVPSDLLTVAVRPNWIPIVFSSSSIRVLSPPSIETIGAGSE